MDILDKLFKVKPVIEDEENFSELEKKNLRSYRRRIKEANEEISKLESRIKELREIEQEKKILFPFQKSELLNKELKLLEIKLGKGANISRINKVKGNKQKVEDLREINQVLKKKIRKKEKEQKQFWRENVHSKFKGISLYTDPREQYQDSIEEQEKYKRLVSMLDKMINKLESARQLRNSIVRHMKMVDDWGESRRVVKIKNHISQLESLKSAYERQTHKGYLPQLLKVEKKLEEWREKELKRLEDKEKLKSAMLELE